MIRFEILLPLFYNDGQVIEREKFVETDDDFVRRFGATSTDTVVVRGHWFYQSAVYHGGIGRTIVSRRRDGIHRGRSTGIELDRAECVKEGAMADIALKNRIRDALKKGYFTDPDDLVDVSDGHNGNVHVVIVSRKFDRRRMKEKHDLIWSVLTRQLQPEEWGQITLSIGVSPEEIKAT